jgi:cell division ATPase FtsA
VSEPQLRTVWRLVRVPELAQRLDVELVVDTTAPAVVEAIEAAAERAGVELERVGVEELDS